MKTLIFLCGALLLMNLVLAENEDDSCPDDYTPCSCSVESGYYAINCQDNASIKEIRNVFARIEQKKYFFDISFSAEDLSTLPADLLSGKKATEIKISCPSPDFKLKIDKDAFKDSRGDSGDEWGTFSISGCDLSDLDFSFLDGFHELSALQFESCRNFHFNGFKNFPELKRLETIRFDSCYGLEQETMTFPLLHHGLYALSLSYNELDNAAVSRILDWALYGIANSSDQGVAGHETMAILTLSGNKLNRVPDQINKFVNLDQVFLGSNLAPLTVPRGSLAFHVKPTYVDLESSSVYSIEDGAFSGDFSIASLNLKSNSGLMRFDENVFKPVLDGMIQNDATGLISLTESRIDCETDHCHLAWLIRQGDGYREHIVNGKCIDGRHFDELQLSDFSDCAQ